MQSCLAVGAAVAGGCSGIVIVRDEVYPFMLCGHDQVSYRDHVIGWQDPHMIIQDQVRAKFGEWLSLG